MMKTQDISVVIPTLNEAGNLVDLVARLHKTFSDHDLGYELIFIDDHSTDQTIEVLRRLAQSYPIRVAMKVGAKGK